LTSECAGSRWKPSDQGTAIAFEVDDFENMNAELKKRGASYWLKPSETPICWMAIVQDPHGNKIVIHKRKAAT
jgi:predicted enzyme related to lactoylglutathione lyase